MQERAEAHPQTEQRHVLIVEDEVLIRAPLAEHLRETGFDVIEASTADEAWSYLQTGMPVDLVFSDIRMPGSMDGLELANRVKRCYPTIPVILTAANYYRDTAQTARLL